MQCYVVLHSILLIVCFAFWEYLHIFVANKDNHWHHCHFGIFRRRVYKDAVCDILYWLWNSNQWV